MVYKLTLDGGILREAVLSPSVKILKQWEAEGKVELFESDRAKTNDGPTWAGSRRGAHGFNVFRKTDPGNISFQRVAAVLFPKRDPNRLNMTEVNEVAHIIRHHTMGRSIFITNNVAVLIADGKREGLKTAFQIVVSTPEEAVSALQNAADTATQEVAPKVAKRGAR